MTSALTLELVDAAAAPELAEAAAESAVEAEAVDEAPALAPGPAEVAVAASAAALVPTSARGARGRSVAGG